MVHGEEEAQKAQSLARALFAGHGDVDNMPSTSLVDDDFNEGMIGLLDLMVKCGLAPSKKEARRLVEQGGVEVNSEKATDPAVRFEKADFMDDGMVLKKGKKVFHKVVTV